MEGHTHCPSQRLQSLLPVSSFTRMETEAGSTVEGVDIWGLPSFLSVRDRPPSDCLAGASVQANVHLCTCTCVQQVCTNRCVPAHMPVCMCTLCEGQGDRREGGGPHPRGALSVSASWPPGPVTFAQRELCLSTGPWPAPPWSSLQFNPKTGPLSTEPTPNPMGQHTCDAGAFRAAAEPHQLLHHVLGDLQVLVTVTGLGTEGVLSPGEAPPTSPPQPQAPCSSGSG